MRKFLLAILLMLSTNAAALQINSAASIPANSSWAAFVDLGNDFDQARIYLDEVEIASVFACGSELCNASFDKTKVFAAQPSGSMLALLFAGVSSGTHMLEAKLFENSSEINSSSTGIAAIAPLDESYKTEVEQAMASQQAGIDALSSQFNAAQAKIAELNALLEESSVGIGQIQSRLSELDALLSSLQSESTEKIKQLEAEISGINSKLQGQATELDRITSTGFISFGSMNPAIVLAVIIALAVMFIVYRNRRAISSRLSGIGQKSIYGKESKTPATETPESSGKWAFKK